MKKNFKFYAITWAIILVMFNVVVFATRVLTKFVIGNNTGFWVAYSFISLAFVGQLVCAFLAFKPQSRDKLFLRISIVTESYTALIAILIVGVICMLIPNCPSWIVAVACILVVGFSAITVIQTYAAGDIVADVGQAVKVKTFFIKSLTDDVQSLLNTTKNDKIKVNVKKVYEAVKYSDPMSSDELKFIESKITEQFFSLENAIKEDNIETVKICTDDLLNLINSRNNKCKLLK